MKEIIVLLGSCFDFGTLFLSLFGPVIPLSSHALCLLLQVNIARCSMGALVLFGALIGASLVSSDRDHGAFENGSHTACCLVHSPTLVGLSVALGVSSSLSGVAGMYLSLLAGSNFRALTYVGRAVIVLFLQVCF